VSRCTARFQLLSPPYHSEPGTTHLASCN